VIESLQSVIEKIDDRIRERSNEANKAGRTSSYWVAVYTAQIFGLLDARLFLMEEIERLQNETR